MNGKGRSSSSSSPGRSTLSMPDNRGFILPAVLFAIALLATIAFVLGYQGASQTGITTGELERDQLRYVAEAGLAHAKSQLAQNTSCSGYTDIAKTDFAGESYSVNFNTTQDSPAKFSSTAESQNGAKFMLKVEDELAYQPPIAVTLQLGEEEGKDVHIDSFYPNANYGGMNDVTLRSKPSWVQRPLLEFDLTGIPAGVKILSATLDLQLNNLSSPGIASAHRVTRSWEEGTGKGTGNADGATWNEFDGNSPWALPGGEYDASPVASIALSSADLGRRVSWEIGDLVDDWVSGRIPNFGVALIGDGTVDNAKFSSRSDPDTTSTPKLNVIYACECGKTCGTAPPAGKNVLLVVADAVSPSAQDAAKQTLIEGWGHTVNLIDDDAPQADFDAAYTVNDVAYMSEEIATGALSTKLRNATIGVVFEEQKIPDELGVSSAESVYFETSIDVTDNTHYITETFSTGALTIVSSSQEVGDLGGTLAPDLQVLAQRPSSTTPTLAVIETGGALFDGGTAEGRRVKVPWGGNTFDITALTADGETIMKRSIEWGAGAGAAAASGPIAHWKLDDGTGTTAIDSEGGHDGTLTTGGPVWVAGTIGDALQFDGAANYVDLTSDAALDDVFVGGATVMAWIEPASWGGNGYGRIFDKSSSPSSTGDGWAIRLNKDNGGLNFGQGFTSGRGWWRFAESSINFNTWQHVALAYDASSTANDPVVYLNGSPVAVTRVDTPSGAIRSDAAINLRLGSHASVVFNVFDGKIDDARIYDHMLSAAEIAAAAAGGGGGGSGGAAYIELYQPWSASSADTWQTANLSSYGVPANAVVEVAVTNSNTGKEYWGGVRAVGSSLERRLQLHEAEGGGVDAVVMHVQANASSQIQHYSEATANVTFTLLGYWTSAVYVERFDAFKAGANASWRAHNLGAYGVGPNQVAEIAMSQTSTSIEWLAGTRRSGSSLTRLISLHEAEGGGVDATTMQVQSNASSSIEVFAEADSVVDFHLLGYWSTPPGTYTEAGGVSGQVSALLTWEAHDLSTFGVPAGSVAQMITTNDSTGADVEIGVRQTGSSLNRLFNLQEAEDGGSDSIAMHVNVDASSSVEWYAQYGGGLRFFHPIGWWVSN